MWRHTCIITWALGVAPRSFFLLPQTESSKKCTWTLLESILAGKAEPGRTPSPPHLGLFPVPGSAVTTQRGAGKRAASCCDPGMDQELCRVHMHRSVPPLLTPPLPPSVWLRKTKLNPSLYDAARLPGDSEFDLVFSSRGLAQQMWPSTSGWL